MSTEQRWSLAARGLAFLPFAAVGGWSANAARRRLEHTAPAEFIVGSMDDTIADTLETGDLVLFNRDVTALQPLAALHTWLLRRRLQPRFDHMGVIFVDRLGHKFVLEETLGRVQCRPYSARILASEATEIVVVPLKLPIGRRDKSFHDRALDFVREHAERPSRVSLRQTAMALIDPASYAPVAAERTPPLFPSAALVAEYYEALGLVDPAALTADPRVNKATIQPRHWVARANGIRLRPDSQAAFGSPLPIRLQ